LKRRGAGIYKLNQALSDFCERKLNAAKLEQKGMDITTSHNKSDGKDYS
jgi:hypothetical protein